VRILKVGGGVLTGPAPVRSLVKLVEQQPGGCTVVVSAFGKTTNALEYVVGECLAGRQQKALDALSAILEWHRDLAQSLGIAWEALGIPAHADAVQGAVAHGPGDPPGLLSDFVVSLGEQLSSRLVAAFLAAQGMPIRWVDATRIVITDDCFGAAAVRWKETRNAMRACVGTILSTRAVPVVAGFVGATDDGQPTTLGREGSDYTAALLGAALGADEVVLLKNVRGVLTADPRVVPDAYLIGELSCSQAARMFRAGAKVVHPSSIEPLRRARIPLRVALFGDSGGGTVIGPDRSWGAGAIRAVVGWCGVAPPFPDSLRCRLTVLGEPPIPSLLARRVEDALEAMKVKVRRRDPSRGTWILEADQEQGEDVMCGLHTLVDCPREEP
jgi:aspartate kinase